MNTEETKTKEIEEATLIRRNLRSSLLKSLFFPLFVLAFFVIAPHWLNYKIRKETLQQVDAQGKLSGDEAASFREKVAKIDFEQVALHTPPGLEKLRQGLDESGVTANFQHLRLGLYGSLVMVGLLAVASVAITLLAKKAAQGRDELISSFRLSWRIGMVASLIKVILLLPLMTYGAFELMVFLMSAYSIKILAVIIIGGLVALWGSCSVLLKNAPIEFQEHMSRELTPEDAPELWQAVRAAAERLQTAPPDHILVGMQLNFYVTEMKVRHDLGVVCGRTLYLSYPLMKQFSGEEVISIVGHELGHFIGEDTKMSREFFPLKYKAHQTMVALVQAGISGWTSLHFLSFFNWSFAGVEQQASRDRELLADQKGAMLTSPQIAGRALVKVHVLTEAFNVGVHDAIRAQSPNPLDVPLHAVIREKLVPKQEFWTELFERKISHPLDSHPPLNVRLNSLGQNVSIADAQEMSLTETESAYTIWLSHRANLFSELTRQMEEVVNQIKSKTMIAEADVKTAEGKELLTKHFPELKWQRGATRVLAITLLLGLLAGLLVVPAFFFPDKLAKLVFVLVALVALVVPYIHWVRHRSGELTLNAEGVHYTGWKRPLRFDEIKSVQGQKTYGEITVTFQLVKKSPPIWKNSLLPFNRGKVDLGISGFNEKAVPIFEKIFYYFTRQVR